MEKRLVVGFPRHQTFRSLVIIYREDDRAGDAENFARRVREALVGSGFRIDVSTLKVKVDAGKDMWREAERASEEYYEFLSGLGAASPPPEVEGLVRAWIYRRKLGVDRLPAVVLDDKVLSKGRLPSFEAVAKELGLSEPETSSQPLRETEATIRIAEEQRASAQAAGAQVAVPEPEIGSVNAPASAVSSTPAEPVEALSRRTTSELGSADFDDETKNRIRETLLKTGFVGPESCTNCLYYSEEQGRCGFLHVPVADTQKPVCRMKFD